MNNYKIKSKYNSIISKIEENKIKKYKNHFFIFFAYIQNFIQRRKYFKKNISKFLLLFEILLIIVIKLNFISSQLINNKRNIMVQSSSIKLKIENSGNQIIFFNGSFIWCNPVTYPDEIKINGEKQIEIKNEYYFEHNNNVITLTWNNALQSTTCMFNDCTSITEIDLSNFEDSQLTQMQYMFYNCQSLKKIEMSNIKGYKVYDAGLLFGLCSQIESINLENFYPHNYDIQIHYMFEGCNSLISLNYPNFNKKYSKNIEGIFNYCNNLQYINIENAIIKNEVISSFDIINSDSIICTHSPVLILIIKSKSATLNCQNNYCINQIEEDDCSSLGYKYKYNNKFYENCPDGTYNNNFNCIDCNEKCSSCSKDSTEQNLCLSCNNLDNYYEKYIGSVNSDSLFKECLKSPEGFYLDSTNLLYKPCYLSCLSCDKNGNEDYHNCIECNDEYKYELKLNDYFNCYDECPYYFYIEENIEIIKYKCTLSLECPENYYKLIPNLGKCIDKCENEDNYKYEYRNQCYNDCPEGTKKNNNTLENDKKYLCKPICEEEEPFEIIKEQKCVKYCTTEELNNNICILNFKSNNQENSNEDILIKNFENYFTSEDYNTTKIEQGEEEIFQEEEFTITFTTSENQKKNINNNMTKIDLGQCEIELRKFYNLSDDKILYMKKIDINMPGMKIPKVIFDVYCKLNDTNLIKLDLSVCENSRVEISIPIKIEDNLDKLNSSSGYFNDICYITTSESGTDIPLEDRKKDFVENNKTICQEDCYFSEYNSENQNAKCLCKVQEFESFSAGTKIDKDNLYENFINIKNIINIKIIKCYKVLFNKKGIVKNIAFYIISAIILFHLINIAIFYGKYRYSLKNKIKEIIFGIKNLMLIEQNALQKIETTKLEEIFKRKSINIKNGTKKRKRKINKNNIYKNIKGKNKKRVKLFSQINYNFYNKIVNKYYPLNKSLRKMNFSMHKSLKTNSSLSKTKEYKITSKATIRDNINNQDILKKVKEIMKYNDEELNSLSYQYALVYDKRNYCQYYISLLKTRNVLIFSFCYNKDYNSQIIKIDLFFICFILFFTVNALFFNDSTMHKIYEDKGSFNLLYQLPQIIYSSFISSLLNMFLNFLALSEENILNLKNNRRSINLDRRVTKLNKVLDFKFLLYFIISFILLLFFGYYLSIFCSVYRNTQIHLIKDTLISFLLSFVYPFGIYLIPGIFRILALSKLKNKRHYLYKFSQVLQTLLSLN